MSKYPSGILTVVIRDDSPFVHLGEPSRHRTVHIKLTSEQLMQLRLEYVGTNVGVDQYETVSQCWMEPEEIKLVCNRCGQRCDPYDPNWYRHGDNWEHKCPNAHPDDKYPGTGVTKYEGTEVDPW